MLNVFRYQDLVLKALSNEAAPFYLAGGTALAKFYFQHRESFDLDFFCQKYTPAKVNLLVDCISEATGKKMKLLRESHRKGFAKISIYELLIGKKEALKIDFVEDFIQLLKPLKHVDGIDILSLDDIYLRKIHAISGTMPSLNAVGQKQFLGGRQEAKDFYDLYHLSLTHQRLSGFALRYCDDLQKEALIRWYHTYSRSEIKIGLMELKTLQPVDFVLLERHFKEEINQIIKGIV